VLLVEIRRQIGELKAGGPWENKEQAGSNTAGTIRGNGKIPDVWEKVDDEECEIVD